MVSGGKKVEAIIKGWIIQSGHKQKGAFESLSQKA